MADVERIASWVRGAETEITATENFVIGAIPMATIIDSVERIVLGGVATTVGMVTKSAMMEIGRTMTNATTTALATAGTENHHLATKCVTMAEKTATTASARPTVVDWEIGVGTGNEMVRRLVTAKHTVVRTAPIVVMDNQIRWKVVTTAHRMERLANATRIAQAGVAMVS
jgi:hypothetical protein